MTKNKDVENKIYSSLESGKTPSASILDSAKTEMMKRKQTAKRQSILRYAFVPVAMIIIAVFVVLPIAVVEKDHSFGYKDMEYLSLAEFLFQNEIPLGTYNAVDWIDEEFNQSDWNLESDNVVYLRSSFAIVNEKRHVAYVKEDYLYGNEDTITVYVFLSSVANDKTKYFADWNDLTDAKTIMGTQVFLAYDEQEHKGEAAFFKNGVQVFLSCQCKAYEWFEFHIEQFLSETEIEL